MYSNPLVSVIIPVYNGAEFISASVSSVLSQTYVYWELIVIDDWSTDNTEDILKDFINTNNNIHYFKRSNHKKGAASCRNEGLEKAIGTFVIFLDADDELKPFCLEQRVKLMVDTSYDFGVFLQQVKSFDSSLQGSIFNLPITDKGKLILSFMQTTAPIWRLSFLRLLNGFDINYSRMEDPDLHLRGLLMTDEFKCFYKSPSDCIYTLNPLSKVKFEVINTLAVEDAFLFFKKILILKPDFKIPEKIFKNILKRGFFHMLKYFVLSRFKDNSTTCESMFQLLCKNNIFSFFDKKKYYILKFVYGTSSFWVRLFKIRGFFYHVFLIDI